MSTPSPWPYFSKEELTCKCGCGQMKMNDFYMQGLVSIRKALKAPMHITSGYRCPEHNNNVSGSGLKGPHTTGRAVDVSTWMLSESKQIELLRLSIDEFVKPGIGINDKGPMQERFIHIDSIRKRLWSY